MHDRNLRRLIPALGLASALGLAASACGGATSPGSATSSTVSVGSAVSTTSTTSAAAASAAKAAVTTTWTKFFSYNTPEPTRITLLQNGAKYAPIIASVIGDFPKGLSATVSSVKPSGTTATVTYSLQATSGILMSGLTGMAVQVGGKWLVSATTFCGLAALAGATSCPS